LLPLLPAARLWVEVAQFDVEARPWRRPVRSSPCEFEHDHLSLRVTDAEFFVEPDDGRRLLVLAGNEAFDYADDFDASTEPFLAVVATGESDSVADSQHVSGISHTSIISTADWHRSAFAASPASSFTPM
jgi:hypothetical protein